MLTSLVNEFTCRLPGVAHAIVVSPEGLLVAASDSLPAERAEQLAAMTAGVVAVTVGAARLLDGDDVKQAIVEMARGYFVVTTVADGLIVAVLAAPTSDITELGYELARLATEVDEQIVRTR
jgi:predicted regulator of Ras-like GTPase activity (Roadblock/LC7/MglB family)